MINNLDRNIIHDLGNPNGNFSDKHDGTGLKPDTVSSNTQNTTQPSNEYYEEYCKVFMANTVLNAQYKELKAERDQLAHRLEQLQKRLPSSEYIHHTESKKDKSLSHSASTMSDGKGHKRERRTALEISRDHKCPIENCGKAYGTETALNHHLRIKHPEFKK